MIRLHPRPEPFHDCPHCGIKLQVEGWYMPGMRTLAELHCEQCGRDYYGDLLAGHALYLPMLLDKTSGQVYSDYHAEWFLRWLRDSYRQRTSEPLAFTVEEFRPLKKVLLLNCLDTQYGHLLLKLFNAQHYLEHHPDYDLVVIVPTFLRWLVPDGVAAIWTIDLSLRRGVEWNDWLAGEFQRRLSAFDEAMMSVAYSHPHMDDFAIERFTRVPPFEINSWQAPPEQPIVTFIWREDRRWEGDGSARLPARLQRKVLGELPGGIAIALQRAKVIQLAEHLRRQLPTLNFAVVGPGAPTGFPSWIRDLRTTQIDVATEYLWCQQYAQSHVVIGVHGSNMILPSAHAATTVNLLPEDRLGNAAQDLIINEKDDRMTLMRYRMIPLSTPVIEVAKLAGSLLTRFHTFRLYFAHENLDHRPETFPQIAVARRTKSVQKGG